jgi:hypothetical protein
MPELYDMPDRYSRVASPSRLVYVIEADLERLRAIERRAKAPIDWPARFRAAAEVAEGLHRSSWAVRFRDLAEAVESEDWDAVEAVGRALLGEAR